MPGRGIGDVYFTDEEAQSGDLNNQSDITRGLRGRAEETGCSKREEQQLAYINQPKHTEQESNLSGK
jgi:hypothetical protein